MNNKRKGKQAEKNDFLCCQQRRLVMLRVLRVKHVMKNRAIAGTKWDLQNTYYYYSNYSNQ